MTLSTSPDPRLTYGTDVDLFSRASLLDPYADYQSLRDIGEIGYLTRYDMWAVTRYEGVKRVLSQPEIFVSGRGIAMNDTVNTAWAEFAPCLDGDDHAPLRRVMMQSIGPKAASQHKETIEAAAKRLVDNVVEQGEFDAVTEFAQLLPTSVILDLIGLDPDQQTRINLLHWATDSYNCCGPDGTFDDTLPSMEKLYGYVLENMGPEGFRPGSIGHQTWEAADRGVITPEQAMGILGGYATAGLDTTASAIGSLMMLFAHHPDQWSLVRDDPSLIPSAVMEGVRIESPAQWFTRVTTQDVEFGDVVVPTGTRLLHSYGAANRDERKYPDPDRFDVRRNPADNLAFGFGVHACMGKSVSNLEIFSLLTELTSRVDRIEPLGPPIRHVNNLIRSLESQPVRIHPR
ncbi:cytochrome P450 [Rhodococcus sp. NPDC127530]|uniref:cytochrome P450 n=1 Tax=unclassified Rhodococcus (in: high G+C Gram-positive bacteria) TaxID=192944 RepID=UPI00364071DE